MPPKKIWLAEDFSGGNVNTSEFVDLPYMQQGHVVALRDFISKVTKGEPLVGKNKPSWLDDNLDEICHTESYKDNDYWHYHCGPSYSQSAVRSMTYDLGLNLDGLTSAEVIHYQKNSDGSVLVVGFSPNHIPFPPSDAPDYENPLFPEQEPN